MCVFFLILFYKQIILVIEEKQGQRKSTPMTLYTKTTEQSNLLGQKE